MTDAPIGAAELAAVASLWRQQKRELIAQFAGASMLPTIPAGTPLAIACHGVPEVGEVVLAIHRELPLVHRVVALSRDGQWLLTRGDANLVADVPIRAEAIIGRITGIAGGDAVSPVPSLRERGLQRVARWITVAAFRIAPGLARLVVNALWQVLWLIAKTRRAA